MTRIGVVLGFFLALASGAVAQDEPLPDSVARPYLAYEAAIASEDYPAASLAAEQAFAAAADADLPADLQLTLGLNALAMAPSRGTDSGLIEMTRYTVALADRLGDRGAGFEARLAGAMAASASHDYVAFDVLYVDLLELIIEHHFRQESELQAVARIDHPRVAAAAWTPEQRVEGVQVLEAAREAGDPVALANAVIGLQRDAVARNDWARALDLTRNALAELAAQGADGRIARDAVAVALSDILRDGFDSTDSGEAHLAGEARVAWCDYLARRPVALDYIIETRVPMRAVERGLQGVLRTEFSVAAAGGTPQLGESQASITGLGVLQGASREHLEDTHFRPLCAGQAMPAEGALLEGFVVTSAQPTGAHVLVSVGVFSAFTQ